MEAVFKTLTILLVAVLSAAVSAYRENDRELEAMLAATSVITYALILSLLMAAFKYVSAGNDFFARHSEWIFLVGVANAALVNIYLKKRRK